MIQRWTCGIVEVMRPESKGDFVLFADHKAAMSTYLKLLELIDIHGLTEANKAKLSRVFAKQGEDRNGKQAFHRSGQRDRD